MKSKNDDEVMDDVYNQVFGKLDEIRSGSMFGDKTEGAVDNAGTPGMEGVSITIAPVMAGAQEGNKPDDIKGDGDGDDDDEDKLKGIGRMSPLMAQLHGGR